jgi:hypothetical protein
MPWLPMSEVRLVVREADEMYRMLGRERQADLEREARKRQLAAVARAARPDDANVSEKPARRRVGFVPARLAAFLR